jgi:hypothetical protein
MNIVSAVLATGEHLGGDSFVVVLVSKWTVLLAVAWLVHAILSGRNPRWRVALWQGRAIPDVQTIAEAVNGRARSVRDPPGRTGAEAR